MTSNTHSRFSTAPWYELAQKSVAVIGGAGSIGSWTALQMCRSGLSCFVVDFDVLEEHNLGGQFFLADSIGKSKVAALCEAVQAVAPDANIFPMDGSWKENADYLVLSELDATRNTPVIWVAGFDNITARKEMFETFKLYGKHRDIFIDGRMGFDFYELHTCRWGEEYYKEYEATLFEEGESHQAPCTLKSTGFVASHLASAITSTALNHITNVATGDPNARPLPKKFVYMLGWMAQIN